jgi:hypothetical protein
VKFLVVLHKDSVVGQTLGGKAGCVKAGDDIHPALVCDEMDPSHPHYMFARTIEDFGQVRQSLFIPHGSVQYVVRFDEKDPNPVGFVPAA